MGGLLEVVGAGELVDIGLGLATISMLTGVIGGTVLVNWAVRDITMTGTEPVLRGRVTAGLTAYPGGHTT